LSALAKKLNTTPFKYAPVKLMIAVGAVIMFGAATAEVLTTYSESEDARKLPAKSSTKLNVADLSVKLIRVPNSLKDTLVLTNITGSSLHISQLQSAFIKCEPWVSHCNDTPSSGLTLQPGEQTSIQIDAMRARNKKNMTELSMKGRVIAGSLLIYTD